MRRAAPRTSASGTPERAQESAGVLLHHVGRINRTLRQMTDFARRRTEEITAVEVGVAVEDAMRMIRHDPRARRVQFRTDIPSALHRAAGRAAA